MIEKLKVINVELRKYSHNKVVKLTIMRVEDGTIFTHAFGRRHPEFDKMILSIFYIHEIETLGLLLDDQDIFDIGLLMFDRTFKAELQSVYDRRAGGPVRRTLVKRWIPRATAVEHARAT